MPETNEAVLAVVVTAGGAVVGATVATVTAVSTVVGAVAGGVVGGAGYLISKL